MARWGADCQSSRKRKAHHGKDLFHGLIRVRLDLRNTAMYVSRMHRATQIYSIHSNRACVVACAEQLKLNLCERWRRAVITDQLGEHHCRICNIKPGTEYI